MAGLEARPPVAGKHCLDVTPLQGATAATAEVLQILRSAVLPSQQLQVRSALVVFNLSRWITMCAAAGASNACKRSQTGHRRDSAATCPNQRGASRRSGPLATASTRAPGSERCFARVSSAPTPATRPSGNHWGWSDSLASRICRTLLATAVH